MVERYSYNQLTWIDLLNPTSEEVREILSECNIPLEFGSDLTTMVPRSETFSRKHALKTTLDFPVVKRTDISHPHEVKFIATKKHLVTVRFEDIEALHRFQKEVEVSSMLKHAGKNATGAHLFVSLLNELYRTMTIKLDYLESKMTDIEEEIFHEREKEMVFEISRLSRRLIAFRQTLATHEKPLVDLHEGIVSAFGKSYAPHIEKIQDEFTHLTTRVRSLMSMLDDLRDTNDSLVSTKQNEIMKILTIMAFITFPLTLFTSLFGMNTVTTPILGHPNDFWIIVWIMVLVSVGFFVFFKYKRWM